MKTLSFKMRKGFTLIELLVVIGILAILLAITLIAINPARQFRQANDTQRASNINAILNAMGQYTADPDNAGEFPAALGLTPAAQEISEAGVDLCSILVPTYIQGLPRDPAVSNGDPVVLLDESTPPDGTLECPAGYVTGYLVSQDANGRVTVSAPGAEPDVEVTR